MTAVQYSGAAEPYVSAEQFAAVGLTLLAVQMVICLPVYVRAVAELVRRHCTPELLVALFAAVSAADGASVWLMDGRGMQQPFCLVAVVALYFTLRGEMLRLRGPAGLLPYGDL